MADLASNLVPVSERVRRFKKKQRDLERTVEKLKEEMKELRTQNATLQSSMIITHQSHERSIKKLEERMGRVEELEGYINGFEEYFEEAKNKHAADLTQLETRLTQRLRLDDFCNTNAESMSNYMLNNQCGLLYLDKTHKEQLASLEERLTQRLDDVQETNKTNVKNDDVHLARLDEAHQEQLASLEAKLTKRLDDMSKINAESLHSNRLSSQCGLAYLEKTHKAQLTSLEARLSKRLEEVHETHKTTLVRLARTQDGHRAQLDEAHQERLASLDARLSERLIEVTKNNKEVQCNLVAAHQQHLDYLEKAHKEEMVSLEIRLSRRLEVVEASSQRSADNSELTRVKAVLASVDYRTRAQDPRCSDAMRHELVSKARRLVAFAADFDKKAGTMPPIRLSPHVEPEPACSETSSQTTTAKAGWENPAWRAAYIAADKETRRSMVRKAQWC